MLPDSIAEIVCEGASKFYYKKFESLGGNRLLLEKQVMLQVLDVHWKEHLGEIDHLRGSVGLRAYAQKNPKNEFKKEAYSMFEFMLNEIDSETVRILFSIQFSKDEVIENLKNIEKDEITLEKPTPNIDNPQNNIEMENETDNQTIIRNEPKYGRNEIVKITNGQETKEIKYKKAISLIETGEWKLL